METNGFDLSVQQRRLVTTGRETATTSVTVRIDGPLDDAALRLGVTAAAARHEALRTRLEIPEGMRLPVQVVAESTSVSWDDEATVSGEGQALPAVGLQARLRRIGPDEHELHLACPAAASDSAGLVQLAREALAAPTGAAEPAEPLQYADFAAWQQELAQSGDAAALDATAYWRRQQPDTAWDGEPPTRPGDAEREVPADLLEALDGLAARLSADARDVWLAGWVALAARLGDDEAVVVGVRDEGRHDQELDGAVGPYAIELPARFDTVPSSSVAELVGRAGEHRRGLGRHALRPGEALLTGGHSFGYTEVGQSWTAGPLQARVLDRRDARPVADLAVEVLRSTDGARLRVAAVERAGLAPGAERADRTADHLLVLLAGLPQADGAVAALPLHTPKGRHAALRAGVADPAPSPTADTFHGLVEAQAARHADRPAVEAADGTLTYAELDARANRLAHALVARGAGVAAPVAVLLDRRADLAVSLLGVLKSGAAYLPLHADHPVDRLAFQTTDAGARLVVTVADLLDRVPPGCEAVVLDGPDAPLDGQPDGAPGVAVSGDDLAYVIYTSGSTGTPKGVGVSHANLLAYTAAITAELHLDDQPRTVALVTSVSTDLGNTSIVLAWAGGGTLALVPADTVVEGATYAAWTAARPVDVLKITPSHLRALLATGGAAVLPRELLLVGGELLSWDLARRVSDLASCALVNHYGPTETTVGALTYRVLPGEQRPASTGVPVGRPLPGYRAYVLDGHGEPVAEGADGELVIGGPAVARGYVGRGELTAERFVADPLGDGRAYRTGDVVRRHADGAVEFLGRADGQVKIRGFRVEPGEVEAVLESADQVRQAAVIALPEPHGEDLRLVAYVVGDVTSAGDVDALRRLLTQRLPGHLVPGAVVPLDALPLTPNGKLDRRALPDPESVRLVDEASYTAPRDEIETTIAAVWAALLGVERVGVEDDFFGLGGHSLLAAQVIARILRDFGVQLPLHSLFVAPTVAALADLVRAERSRADDDLAAVLAEVEGMSEEEAERFLAQDSGTAERR